MQNRPIIIGVTGALVEEKQVFQESYFIALSCMKKISMIEHDSYCK